MTHLQLVYRRAMNSCRLFLMRSKKIKSTNSWSYFIRGTRHYSYSATAQKSIFSPLSPVGKCTFLTPPGILISFLPFFALLATGSPLQAQQISQQDNVLQCFAVADKTAGDDDKNTLYNIIFSADDSVEGTITLNGEILNGSYIEAIALVPDENNPGEFTIYAANADQFGQIDFTVEPPSARFISLGDFAVPGRGDGLAKGMIEGAMQNVPLDDVDSLTYDAKQSIMYGVHRRERGKDEGKDAFDLLFKIELQQFADGAVVSRVVPNAFNAQFDFVEVKPADGADVLADVALDVDDIAIHPRTRKMYAVINAGGGTVGRLAELDPSTGIVSRIFDIRNEATGLVVSDIEGLAFSNEPQPKLYGSTGDRAGSEQNQFFFINLDSADSSSVLAKEISRFKPEANDVEGLGCLTGVPLTSTIDLEKSTNRVDADTQADGLQLVADCSVTWRYEVTNTGELPLHSVNLQDDKIGAIQCPSATLAVGEAMTCFSTGTAIEGDYGGEATVTALSDAGTVSDIDASYYTGVQATIQLEKSTNGQDADDAPGPQLEVGSSVRWEYVVTNTGDAALTDIVVTDNKISADEISCPQNSLAPGESLRCTATGIARPDQYRNDALVTARAEIDSSGDCLISDTDTSHYFAGTPGIDVEKFTNGIDADSSDEAVQLVENCPVRWRYEITNTGDVLLSNITLTDDKIGAIQCVDSLEVGETVSCDAPLGIAIEGAYRNLATVTGISAVGSVTDEDASNYRGLRANIIVEKSTNGYDSDVAPGRTIPAGTPVTWTYLVTNTGDVKLRNIRVIDDQIAEDDIDCGTIRTLEPGESITCTASDMAISGSYKNLATVLAEPDVDDGLSCVVDTSDLSHYQNVRDLIVERNPTADWSYAITNTGQVSLTQITLDGGPNVTTQCPQDILLVGESMTCSANGPAEQLGNEATVLAIDPVRNTPLTLRVPGTLLDGLAIDILINDLTAADELTPSLLTRNVNNEDNIIAWQFVISNHGAQAVEDVVVEIIDLSRGERQQLECPASEMAAGESMICLTTSTVLEGRNGVISTAIGKFAGTNLPAYADTQRFYNGETFATVGGRLFIDELDLFGHANGLQDLNERSLFAPDIEIALYAADNDEDPDNDEHIESVNVDSDGRYLFENVRPGNYYMIARRPSVTASTLQGFVWSTPNQFNNRLDSDVDPSLDADPDTAQTENFRLESGKMDTSWDIGFQQKHFTGISFIDSNGNQQYDDGEVIIDDVTVQISKALESGDQSVLDGPNRSGIYALPPLNPSIYDLTATHPDYVLKSVASENGTVVNFIAEPVSNPYIYLPIFSDAVITGGK